MLTASDVTGEYFRFDFLSSKHKCRFPKIVGDNQFGFEGLPRLLVKIFSDTCVGARRAVSLRIGYSANKISRIVLLGNFYY